MKGFTKCLKIVKLFSITGVCVSVSRVIMASWFRSKYFLQSRDAKVEGKFLFCFFQIGHRERFSLWGKNPIDYRESHFYIQPDWKSWENFDHESVRPTEYGPARRSCLPFCHNGALAMFWQIATMAARCNFDRRGFLHGTLRVIIRSISNKTKHCVSVCVYAAIISALKKQWQKSYPLNLF